VRRVLRKKLAQFDLMVVISGLRGPVSPGARVAPPISTAPLWHVDVHERHPRWRYSAVEARDLEPRAVQLPGAAAAEVRRARLLVWRWTPERDSGAHSVQYATSRTTRLGMSSVITRKPCRCAVATRKPTPPPPEPVNVTDRSSGRPIAT
jgi:hypothetical protein